MKVWWIKAIGITFLVLAAIILIDIFLSTDFSRMFMSKNAEDAHAAKKEVDLKNQTELQQTEKKQEIESAHLEQSKVVDMNQISSTDERLRKTAILKQANRTSAAKSKDGTGYYLQRHPGIWQTKSTKVWLRNNAPEGSYAAYYSDGEKTLLSSSQGKSWNGALEESPHESIKQIGGTYYVANEKIQDSSINNGGTQPKTAEEYLQGLMIRRNELKNTNQETRLQHLDYTTSTTDGVPQERTLKLPESYHTQRLTGKEATTQGSNKPLNEVPSEKLVRMLLEQNPKLRGDPNRKDVTQR